MTSIKESVFTGQSQGLTNILTEYVKVDNSVVEFELHTLTGDRIKHNLVEWPARCHIDEILAFLRPVLRARIQKAGRRWNNKGTENKSTKPKIEQCGTIRLAYSFKNTFVHMHCLFTRNGEHKGCRMFGEKLLVYACPTQKTPQATVAASRPSKMETRSSYFCETASAVNENKPKLPRPLSRRGRSRKVKTSTVPTETTTDKNNGGTLNIGSNSLEADSTEMPKQDTLSTKGILVDTVNTEEFQPDTVRSFESVQTEGPQPDTVSTETSCDDQPWGDPGNIDVPDELLDDSMELPPVSFITKRSPVRMSGEERVYTMSQALASLSNTTEASPTKCEAPRDMDIDAGCSRLDSSPGGEPTGEGEYEEPFSKKAKGSKAPVRKGRGRYKKLLALVNDMEQEDMDMVLEEFPPNQTQDSGLGTDSDVSLDQHIKPIDIDKWEPSTSSDFATAGSSKTRPVRSVSQTSSKNINKLSRKANKCRLRQRKLTEELVIKGKKIQRLSGASEFAGACKIDMSQIVDDLKNAPNTMEEEIQSVKNVGDLTLPQLTYLVTKHEVDLLDIFQGKKPSRRHQDYKAGGKERNNLKYQIPMGCFGDEQHDTIMELLLARFCRKHNRYLDYVLKVMLPEALILVYAHVHKIKEAEAEDALTPITPDVNFVR